ncbi:MAG: AMP-binding protein [Pseudomonadota bacterium]
MVPTSQQQAFDFACTSPTEFWASAARAIDWIREPSSIHDANDPLRPNWFSGGELNTCFNAIDRHVNDGRGDDTALIFVSAMTGTESSLTFAELQTKVAKVAGALVNSGIAEGDRVIIYMPMIVEAVIAMLACARIGAVHSVVFGGFAPAELSKRIRDAAPRLLLTASCGLEPGRVVEYLPLVEAALEGHAQTDAVVLQRPGYERILPAGWSTWSEWLANAPLAPCVALQASDPLYILYTSGTTGTPKGVVRDNGGHAVALRWSMQHVFDAKPGDVFWAASDIGWVVGHSYIVYGPLLTGCATVIYEGKPVGTPDASQFWRIIERHSVTTLFTAPTAIRAIRRDDPAGEGIAANSLASLRTLFLAGERTDPNTLNWIRDQLQRPVIDNWWQTELGWPALAVCQGLTSPTARVGSAGFPVPGFDVRVIDTKHRPCTSGQTGDVVIRLPLPPGATSRLWGQPDGFVAAYCADHPGFYNTGDTGEFSDDGSISIMGRNDDLINVAGHRLSTGAMEEVVAAVDGVAECAVIAVRDMLKGEVPVAVVVPSNGQRAMAREIPVAVVRAVRNEVGPVAALKRVVIVERLPKTRSGKVLRKTLRALANGDSIDVPATIDDPSVIDAVAAALH